MPAASQQHRRSGKAAIEAMTKPPPHLQAPSRMPDRFEGLLQQAIMALNAQRPGDAERLAGEVLKAEPRHVAALKIAGRAARLQGRAGDAIALLEPAARSSHDAELDTELALALQQAGRADDAASRLRRAVKRSPPYPPAFAEFAQLLISLKRFDEAAETLKRGVEAAPMAAALQAQLGFLLLERHNHAQAKAVFARLLTLYPGFPDALFGLGKTHQELHENEPAVAHLRQYLMARPAHWGAWISLGHCLLALGDFEAGYDCFRTAARGDPKHYTNALSSLVKSPRGRFWLKPSAGADFLLGAKR
jgi:tetratricopeptide (TPR) repeat protein